MQVTAAQHSTIGIWTARLRVPWQRSGVLEHRHRGPTLHAMPRGIVSDQPLVFESPNIFVSDLGRT